MPKQDNLYFRQRMKSTGIKKGVRYIVFFVILLALILCAGFIFVPHNYDPDSCDKDLTKNWLGEEDDSIDMIVLGDSECYTSLDPNRFEDQTGLSTFLCSSSGQRLVDAYLVLKEVLETQSPEYVMLESDMLYLEASGEGEIKKAAVAEAENLLPFFRYHGRWKYLTPDVLLGKTGTTDPLRGFRVYTDVLPYEGGEYMFETGEAREINPVNRYYLRKIRELCDENGIKLIMMSAPSPNNWTWDKHNGAALWAAENEVPFYDMNLASDEVGIDWQTDCLDGGDHINYYGACKTTNYMAERFNEEIL